jgi:transcription elongation factor GreA
MTPPSSPESRPNRFLSPEQHDRLREDLEEIRRRKVELGIQIAETSDMFSGEAEGNVLKEDFLFLLREESRINALLHRATARLEDDPAPGNHDAVTVGVTVTVETLGEIETYTIVGPGEWRPGEDLLSYTSPLGRALLGRKAGDSVTLTSPGGHLSCRIVAIEG